MKSLDRYHSNRATMSCNGNTTNILLLGLVSAMTSDIRTSQLDEQEFLTFIYIFPLIIVVAFGILSNLLSIDTFRQRQIRTTPTGFFLIIYSYCSIFGLFMLEIRLLRMRNSVSYLISFVLCNIISVLALMFTRICLWMNGFLALQRVIYTFESNYLVNRFCSHIAVKKQILFIITLVFLMHIHDILYRVSIPDPLLQGNFICQTGYPVNLLILNQIFSLTHLFVPCALNIIANILILASISRRRANLHQTTYWTQWRKHFRRHHHLFLAPTLIIVESISF